MDKAGAMGRNYYTEQDIVDLLKRGVRVLELGEDDRLTDVARERAIKEGIQVVSSGPEGPPRPYLVSLPGGRTPQPVGTEDLRQKVKQAVLAKLGDDVEQDVLDRIIRRVFDQMGL